MQNLCRLFLHSSLKVGPVFESIDLSTADLHIHSNCSDGSDGWETILRRCEREGLKCISITDHDNCEVYTQISNPERYFSGRIITGIEMQAYYAGLSIELLGYGFDVSKMRELLKGLYLPFDTVNREEMRRLHERCTAAGMVFPPDVTNKYDSRKHFYATTYLHEEMQKNPSNKAFVPDEESWLSERVFYKRHTSNPNSSFYVDESDLIPSVSEVIDVIHNAGGKVFIPHIYQYGEHSLPLLKGLTDNYKIEGIECYYPTFTQAQTNYLLDFCIKHNMLVSKGSDYHTSSP